MTPEAGRLEARKIPIPPRLFYHGVKHAELGETRKALQRARDAYEAACTKSYCDKCQRGGAGALDVSRLGENVASLTRTARELAESLEASIDPAKAAVALDTILQQFGENLIHATSREMYRLGQDCGRLDEPNAARHRAIANEAFRRIGKSLEVEFRELRELLGAITGASEDVKRRRG